MIYIVRHGQTDWNLEGRYQGRIDTSLNQKGIMQAQLVAQKLKGKKFDRIYSSPLKRAYQTAEIICQPYDMNITVDERLIERGNGLLEGELKSQTKYFVDFTDPSETAYGIETLPAFRTRIYDFLKEIIGKYRDQEILVVTHAGVSIYAKCFFLGEPADNNYSKYKLRNCEIAQF